MKTPFIYQPEKVTPGAVYHYLKTNRDGSDPEHVSLYVAAPDRLEVFKFHPGGSRAAWVVAQMDYTLFCACQLTSWQVYGDGRKLLVATLEMITGESAVSVQMPLFHKPPERVEIGYRPFHVYNFDLASLNMVFRHLVTPTTSFTIGLADPTFQEEGPAFFYRGEVVIEYVQATERNGRFCHQYHINGTGLENRGGFLWVNGAGGYFEDVEIELPDNPDWQDFKLCLQQCDTMSDGAWQTFMAAQFGV